MELRDVPFALLAERKQVAVDEVRPAAAMRAPRLMLCTPAGLREHSMLPQQYEPQA